MSTFEAAVAAMKGYGDKFDVAIGVVEYVEELLAERDIPVECHTGQAESLASDLFGGDIETKAHFHDPKAEMEADLKRARELIEEARQLTFKVLSEMP